MKKFLFAAFATFGFVGFVMAESMTVQITSVDSKAGTIMYTRGFGGFGKAPEPQKGTLAKDCVIAKGVKGDFDKGGGFGQFNLKAGDKLEKGLDNDAFKPAEGKKGIFASITVADEDKGAVKKGQITEILVPEAGIFGAFGKKGAKKGGGN